LPGTKHLKHLKQGIMKKLILVFAVIGFTTLAQAQGNKTPYITKNISETIKQVQVETSGGSIEVAGGTNETKVEVFITGNNGLNAISNEEIEARLKESYTLDVHVTDDKLVAIAKQKSNNMNWKKSLSISFKIYVPVQVNTQLTTSGGSINLSNLNGSQRFATSGGSLTLDKLAGNTKGSTSGGSIKVSNSTDNIDLSTSGGSINADGCKGNLDLSTSGGSVHLFNLDGIINAATSGGKIEGNNITGELSAATSGGSINLTNIAGSLSAGTSGGSMNIGITKMGSYLKLGNSGGNIDISLPKNQGLDLDLKANKIKVSSLNNFNGTTDENSINGTLNGGGVPVKVKASSGRININFN
jgi:hypothetical protein